MCPDANGEIVLTELAFGFIVYKSVQAEIVPPFVPELVALQHLIENDVQNRSLNFALVVAGVVDLAVHILLGIGQEIIFLAVLLDQRLGLQTNQRIIDLGLQFRLVRVDVIHHQRGEAVNRRGHFLDMLDHEQKPQNTNVKGIQTRARRRLGKYRFDVIVDKLIHRLKEAVKGNEHAGFLIGIRLGRSLESIQQRALVL